MTADDTLNSPTIHKPLPPLSSPIRLLLALSALCATLHPSYSAPATNIANPGVNAPIPTLKPKSSSQLSSWLSAVIKLLEIDPASLPSDVLPDAVRLSAEGQRDEWTEEEKARMAGLLVEASLTPESNKSTVGTVSTKEKKEENIKYTAEARAACHRALSLLGLDVRKILPAAEKDLSSTLFKALKAAAAEADKKVESTRAAHSQGWGGTLGRSLATGAGVIAGGVLLGVTGGLAAPAIAAVLAPLGIGSILSASAAPVVLGTLFGVGGGGLAGRRVRERWRGVEEFGFIEVGAGTKATKEEIEDLNNARRAIKKHQEEMANKEKAETVGREVNKVGGVEEIKDEKVVEDVKPNDVSSVATFDDEKHKDVDAQQDVDAGRIQLEAKLLELSLEAGTRASISSVTSSPMTTPATSATASPRASLDAASGREENALTESNRPPSLTATIIVPGLLSVSKTEAITAWRALCADNAPPKSYKPRGLGISVPMSGANGEDVEKKQDLISVIGKKEDVGVEQALVGALTTGTKNGLKDGRDVYLLRYETDTMLKTGRDVDFWVASKLKGLVKKEIIKRTVLSAYFAAVSLPLSVYSMATMTLDNTWMKAQDRAIKAGRLLGEVIEKRVQGERPVILIGTSVGALTVFHALLYLSTLPTPLQTHVESAHLISLPSSPTAAEWARARSVVTRRLTNGWTDADLVLAGVVRLHEVVSRAAVGSSGIKVAGLGPVCQVGVEDVDLSRIVRGHFEIHAKLGEILKVLDIDG